jgi:hypothetical protein
MWRSISKYFCVRGFGSVHVSVGISPPELAAGNVQCVHVHGFVMLSYLPGVKV